jgi:hypothetical protein
MVDWNKLLERWSRELMATQLAETLDPPPALSEWLGYEPASESEIGALESRLGLVLPPSYKAFLATTDGWRTITSFINRIRPTAEVDWFRVENEQWVEIYGEDGSSAPDEIYYQYTPAASDYRADHMIDLVQISDVGDGVLLLNPKAVTPDGEWEAWFFANWIPGASRHPSFAHLILAEYQSFRRLEKVAGRAPKLRKLPIPGPEIPRVSAEKLSRAQSKSEAQTLESLILEMQSSDTKKREKAMRAFFGKLKGRYRATRRPDLAKQLTDLYYQTKSSEVRQACVAGLTELAEDSPAPKPLFDALSDSDPNLVLQGIFALEYFPNPRAVELLCRFIESDANPLMKDSAMSRLGEIGDPKAVPTLRRMLFNIGNKFDQSFATAGLSLGRCGPLGVDALVSALDHADRRVRFAAVVGLDISGDVRAKEHLDQMVSDPDPEISARAKIRMGPRLFTK